MIFRELNEFERLLDHNRRCLEQNRPVTESQILKSIVAIMEKLEEHEATIKNQNTVGSRIAL